MKHDLFTQRIQLTWIFILVVALVGIGQAFSLAVYQVSILTVISAGVGQIAIGNVPPDASPSRFFRFLAIFAVVIVATFVASIASIPYLVNLGR